MKHTIKVITALTLVAVFLFSFTACKNTESEPIKIMALKGPTGMGMAYLMENNADKYDISLAGAPDDIVAAFSSGEAKIAAVPINLASTLYHKLNGDVVMLAINTLGVLYIIENGNTIQSLEDLEGKTIYATGKGSTPEYILSYLLKANDINATVEFKAEHSELATLLASKEVDLGMLPEPNVSAVLMKNKDARIALDLTEEWNKLFDSELVQGCLIANKTFVEQNEERIRDFITDYKTSTDFVNNKVEEAAELIAKYEILPSKEAAAKAIPNCNIVMYTANKMKQEAKNMFNILFSIERKSIGGSLPGDDFYYKAD
ncbi:MAG TPA: ABC transporter substrate-binding protein [Clostridiales bacterium]|jgi:NitT/TauT family transport system substrate-binding protein|nr:ABC transporter substrate-binding protein [Clostridiales bacterium]